MTTEQEVANYCLTLPGAYEDYPFYTGNRTIRHAGNRKIFAIFFDRGEGPFFNVKHDPIRGDFWRRAFPAVTPGFHSNKTHWSSVRLDGSLTDEELHMLIDHSFQLTRPRVLQHKKTRPFSTPRLLLRPLSYEDMDQVYRLTSDPLVTKYMRFGTHTTMEETRQLLQEYIAEPGNIPFAILEQETEEFVGVFVFKAYQGKSYSVTTFTGPACWHRGYAKEVMEAAIPYARDLLKAESLVGYAMGDNTASCRALERSGYLLEQTNYYDDCPGGVHIYRLRLREGGEQ